MTLARGRLTDHGLADVEDLFRSDPGRRHRRLARRLRPRRQPLHDRGRRLRGGHRRPAVRRTPATPSARSSACGTTAASPTTTRSWAETATGRRSTPLGHRNQLGAALNPATGELWANENGPLGGDEVNRIRAGGNYGWPVVSYSREYSGRPGRGPDLPGGHGAGRDRLAALDRPVRHGVLRRRPFPPTGVAICSSGALRTGMIRNTGHLERIVFNEQGQEARREWLPHRAAPAHPRRPPGAPTGSSTC